MSFLSNGVTGHRGNLQLFPENTIPSFESAIQLGCDWVETDLRLTSDDKVVLSHDQHTMRCADRQLCIADATLEELRKLNFAENFNMVHFNQSPLKADIPTLEEALELFRSQDKVRLSLQPKVPGALEAAAKIIRDMKIPDELLGFNDGCREYMINARKLFPGSEIFYDIGPLDRLDEDICLARENRFENIVANMFYLNSAAVEKIKYNDIIPGVWTPNCPGEMDRFIAMGVERFYTDFPAVLLEKIK